MSKINIGDKQLLKKMFMEKLIPMDGTRLLSARLFRDDPSPNGKTKEKFEELRKAREDFFNKEFKSVRELEKGRENPVSNTNTKFVSSEHSLKSLIGIALTIIDGIGLPEKQSTAVKDQIKREFWRLDRSHLPESIFKEMVETMEVSYFPAENVKSEQELGY